MTIQSFLCALLPALLLTAPLCAAEPLTAAEIVRNDTTEETIQPPQTRAQAQNEETRDWSRSVVSPVPWLTVEDHVLTVYDESGSKVFCGVYPSLRLAEDACESPHRVERGDRNERMAQPRAPRK